ncbi:MAG: hypothetical protein VB118_04695 [Oscillospiraceae bacterium]|nr:hypothetical protein [Oscillospiraceae bacterium]
MEIKYEIIKNIDGNRFEIEEYAVENGNRTDIALYIAYYNWSLRKFTLYPKQVYASARRCALTELVKKKTVKDECVKRRVS